jgi:hypothetical protein
MENQKATHIIAGGFCYSGISGNLTTIVYRIRLMLVLLVSAIMKFCKHFHTHLY